MMGDVTRSPVGRISYDAEEASIVAAFSEDCVRRGFIRKVEKFRKKILYVFSFLQVYSILSVQLLVIFGTVALFNQSSEVQNLLLGPENDGSVFWVLLVGSAITGFVIILAMLCSRTLRVVVPINFIMLDLFTVVQSLLLGPVLMFIKERLSSLLPQYLLSSPSLPSPSKPRFTSPSATASCSASSMSSSSLAC